MVAPRIFIWGYSPGGRGDRSPSGVHGIGDLADKVPSNRSSLQTLFTDFDYRNDQNLKISAQFTSWFLPVCFTGAKQHWGLASSPCLMAPLLVATCLYVIS